MTDKFNLGDLMKNAKKMQELFQQQQEELEKTYVMGEAGGGAVQIRMSCKHKAIQAKIDPEIKNEAPEVLEELIVAAINDATQKIERMAQEKMTSMGQSLGGLGNLFKGE